MTTPQSWPRPAGRPLAALATVLLASLLLACGGGGDGPDSAPTGDPQIVTLRAHDGSTFAAAEVSLRGATGLPRRTGNVGADGDFPVTRRGLGGVQVARAQVDDPDLGTSTVVYAWVPAGGRANVTPLTTLLLAQLTGQEPSTYYNALARQAPLAPSTADIAAAEDAVAAFLDQDLQLTVAVRDFTGRAFTARAGEPMHDAHQAIQAALNARGETLADLARRLAQQVAGSSATCAAHTRLTVERSADASQDSDCLLTDEIGQGADLPDRIGATAQRVYVYPGAVLGQLLELTLDTDTGRLVSLVLNDQGQTYACRGASGAHGCSGVSVSAARPDPLAMGYTARTVTLAGTVLAAVGADGTLDASVTVTASTELVTLVDPNAVLDNPADCSATTEGLDVALPDEPTVRICPPPLAEDPSARFFGPNADGASTDVFVRNGLFQSLSLTLADDGSVLRVVFDGSGLRERFACGRTAAGEPACDGVTLAPSDAEGNRLLTLNATALRDLWTGDVVGERSATVSGSAVIPPLPPP